MKLWRTEPWSLEMFPLNRRCLVKEMREHE